MTPDADSFRALARSSPWRWRTLHLRARASWLGGEVDAYVQRPHLLVVKDAGGQVHRDDSPAATWGCYTWVAMLDPEELGHHVAADRVRVDVVAGRRSWRADLTALAGYEPLCGGSCCELLWSEVSWRAPGPTRREPIPEGTRFPRHYDVALDLQTGIVLRCLPVGGAPDAAWQEMDVLEVDAPAPDWARVAS